MAQIAEGKGRAPKPFMLAKGKTKADAVWQSNRGDAAEARAKSRTKRKTAALRSVPETKTRSTAQAAKPKKVSAMPDFVTPQLCASIERPPNSDGWCHEIKFDGYRVQLRVEDGDAALEHAQGTGLDRKVRRDRREAASLPDALIDGEIVALDHNGVPDFSALQAALSDGKTGDLIFFAFDLLFHGGEDLRSLPLRERKARLKHLLERRKGGERLIRYVEHFEEGRRCRAAIGQQAAARRHHLQEARRAVSLRPLRELDQGQGARRAGGGDRRLEDHQRKIPLADGRRLSRRSSGLRRRGRHRLRAGYRPTHHAGVEGQASDKSPFGGKDAPRKTRDVHWLKPELVAEIEFAGWTDAGIIRQAAFKGLRQDKPADEVQAEMPVMTKVAKPLIRSGKSSANKSAKVMGVVISKPDKALWPDGGDGEPVTKLDLAHYFEAVGDWMIGHIKGRPCSVVRAPDGIKAANVLSAPRHAGRFEPAEAGQGRGRSQALSADRSRRGAGGGGAERRPRAASLELRADDYDTPGRLVFDLDPAPEVEFDAVIDAAKDMRERLKALGLESFCKTTGGKGLHVVTPLLHGAQ